MIRFTRISAAVVAALALAGCGVAASTGDASAPSSGPPTAAPAGVDDGGVLAAIGIVDMSWQEIAPSPLTPRAGAVTAWTGTKALFLGGDDGPLCPPNADCAAASLTADGAAYDPRSGTWADTAPAPEPIAEYGSSAVIDDTVYLWGAHHLLAYDSGADTWKSFDPPPVPEGFGYPDVVAFDKQIVAVPGQRESGDGSGWILNPAAGIWTPLPHDPLGASFGRAVVATPAGLVLLGHDLVPNPGAESPSLLRAAVYNPATTHWHLLPDSDILGGGVAGWINGLVVVACLGGADGGEVNGWGRMVPCGGTLDPATGDWGPLPNAPTQVPHQAIRDHDVWALASFGKRYVALSGYLLDTQTSRWAALLAPSQAPSEPGDALWADNQLIVVGGQSIQGPMDSIRSQGAWMLTVAPHP